MIRISIYIGPFISKWPTVLHTSQKIMCHLHKKMVPSIRGALPVLEEGQDTERSPGQPVLRLRPGFKTGSERNTASPHIYRMRSWFGEEQGHWGQLCPVKESKPRGLILKVCRGEACSCVRRIVLCRDSLWLRSDSLVSQREEGRLQMLLPRSLKRLLGVFHPSTILPLPHLGLTLPFGSQGDV